MLVGYTLARLMWNDPGCHDRDGGRESARPFSAAELFAEGRAICSVGERCGMLQIKMSENRASRLDS